MVRNMQHFAISKSERIRRWLKPPRWSLSEPAHTDCRWQRTCASAASAYRIFGEPMRFWRNMPIGVNLKSFAFATNIYVPARGYSFPQWCRQHGLEDFEPCTMQSFAAYGCEMQKRFVPDLEEVLVTNIAMRDREFAVTLASGGTFRSRKVVVCTGLSGLAHVPGCAAEPCGGSHEAYLRHFRLSRVSEQEGCGHWGRRLRHRSGRVGARGRWIE